MEQTNFFYKDNPVTFVCAANAQKAQTYDSRLDDQIAKINKDFGKHRVTGLKKQEDGWLFEARHETDGDSYRIFLAGYANTTQDDLFASLKDKVTQGLNHFYRQLNRLKDVINQGHEQICSAFQSETPALFITPGDQRLGNTSSQAWNQSGSCLYVMQKMWQDTYANIQQNPTYVVDLLKAVTGDQKSAESLSDEAKFAFKMLFMQGNLEHLIQNANPDKLPNMLNQPTSTHQKQQERAVNNLFKSIQQTSLNFSTENEFLKAFLQYFGHLTDLSDSPLRNIVSKIQSLYPEDDGFKLLDNSLKHFDNKNWAQIGCNMMGIIVMAVNHVETWSKPDADVMDKFLLQAVNNVFNNYRQDLYDLMDTFSFNLDQLPKSIELVIADLNWQQMTMISSSISTINTLGQNVQDTKLKEYMRALKVEWK